MASLSAKGLCTCSSLWAKCFKMKSLYQAIALSALFFPGAVSSFGEVIDKILVVVNERHIITLSDIQKERTIQLALGTDLGDDDAVANALVDKYLVEEQMARYRGIEISEERIQERLSAIKDSRGLSPEELRRAVISKLQRSEFASQRFGPFVRVSDEELRKYYEEEYIPLVRRSGVVIPTFEQAKDDVRQILVTLRISDELENWMTELLRRAKVEKVSK